MDILTTEIREILARIRDLEDIVRWYPPSDTIHKCAFKNSQELCALLDSKLEEVCAKQLKYEAEVEKLGEQIDMLED